MHTGVSRKGTVPFTLHLPPQVHAALTAESQRQRRSMHTVAVEALGDVLTRLALEAEMRARGVEVPRRAP
jgi:hypothetical protein